MRRILTTGLLFGVVALSAAVGAQDTSEDHVAAGIAAYRKFHFQAAEEHFQAAVDANPGSAAALYYLGYATYKLAEPKRADAPGKRTAAELFARAYAIEPGFTPAWRVSR